MAHAKRLPILLLSAVSKPASQSSSDGGLQPGSPPLTALSSAALLGVKIWPADSPEVGFHVLCGKHLGMLLPPVPKF